MYKIHISFEKHSPSSCNRCLKLPLRILKFAFASFCEVGQVASLSPSENKNFCENKYTHRLHSSNDPLEEELDYLKYCENFEKTFKARLIENKKDLSVDKTESSLWQMDKDEYDWTCLNGCPPGFHCNGHRMAVCPTGASNMETMTCSHCEPGFVCEPGRLPRPCPLGQYVVVKNEDFSVTFADNVFTSMKTYECHDCPR